MPYPYFPGCTLYTKAKSLDDAARSAAKLLGIELQELANWTCCGATFPLAADNVMAFAPPARILANARKEGDTLVTLCATCYNVLKRTNNLLRADKEKRDKLNDFMEEQYDGGVEVKHYLEVLRDEVGWEKLKTAVQHPLAGLRVAPYYGCLLLRPAAEMALDDPERPRLLEDFLAALGVQPVDYPYKAECCGSYLAVGSPQTAMECSYRILRSALRNGAEAATTSCPLCQFNVDDRQKDMRQQYPGFPGVPVLYFTQLLALALGLPTDSLGLDGHYVDPRPLLKQKGLV